MYLVIELSLIRYDSCNNSYKIKICRYRIKCYPSYLYKYIFNASDNNFDRF